MKTNVIEKGKWERELEVEVPAERLEAEFIKACRDYQKRLEVPGFRKGKMPMRMIRTRYGEAIRQRILNDLMPTLLEEATRATGLVPVAPPKIDKLEHESGQALTFTATLDIWPEIEVENYEDLKITRMVHEMTEEEAEEQLQQLRNRYATERSVERPLEDGDVLIADLQRLDESGLPIIGEKFEEQYFIISAEDVPTSEFAEGVMGIRPGEERRVSLANREDSPNPEAGSGRNFFAVSAREVHERTLPELDDEFAKDVGEQFQTMDDLRAHVSAQLTRQWEAMGRQKLRTDLIAELIKKNPFELPESMIENYLESLSREQEGARAPGEEERTAVVRQIKTFLLMGAMRQKLQLEVGDEEFDQYLQQRAEESGVSLEDLKRSARLDDLRRELEEDKVIDFLVEQAEIEEEKV